MSYQQILCKKISIQNESRIINSSSQKRWNHTFQKHLQLQLLTMYLEVYFFFLSFLALIEKSMNNSVTQRVDCEFWYPSQKISIQKVKIGKSQKNHLKKSSLVRKPWLFLSRQMNLFIKLSQSHFLRIRKGCFVKCLSRYLVFRQKIIIIGLQRKGFMFACSGCISCDKVFQSEVV